MENLEANNKNWKSLIKPAKLEVQLSDDKSYAKIIAEPLEKGYGLTLGNSLRRILLSSIRGTAVTAIQIDGVLHEFTSIKGIREDVTDIVLNIKSLALKSSSEGTKKLILDAKGPGEIKASDITPLPDIEILNPELVICNLDENTKFHMELFAKTYHQLYQLNLIGLRFFTVYGPRGRPDMAIRKFSESIKKNKVIQLFGDGTSKRDYIYVSDIVEGILKSLDTKNGFDIINLGGNHPIKLNILITFFVAAIFSFAGLAFMLLKLPGVCKTILAKALAGELQQNFISVLKTLHRCHPPLYRAFKICRNIYLRDIIKV